MKSWAASLLVLALLVQFMMCPARGKDTLADRAEYLTSQCPTPTYGDGWLVVALAQSGHTVPGNYYLSVTQTV